MDGWQWMRVRVHVRALYAHHPCIQTFVHEHKNYILFICVNKKHSGVCVFVCVVRNDEFLIAFCMCVVNMYDAV